MSEHITCPECGFQNQPGDEFCGQCGRYLGWSTGGGPEDEPAVADVTSPATVPAPDPGPRPSPGPSSLPQPYQQPSRQAVPPPQPTFQPSPPPPPPPPETAPRFVPPPAMGGVPCRTCGLVNPPGRTFCQRCGSELDPAVGTVAGSPRPVPGASSGAGGGRKLVAAGLGLVVVAVVAGAAIAFGGVLGGPSPTATPRIALASPSPGASVDATAAPTGEPGPTDASTPAATDVTEPTNEPAPTATARITPRPTRPRTATAAPLETPLGGDLPTPPPAGTYVCDAGSVAIEDPLVRGWNIARVRWGARPGFDHVYLELSPRRALDGAGARATVQVMPVSEVAERLGFIPPRAGRTAVVLSLSEGVRATLSVDQEVTLQKLRAVTAGKDPDGLQWVVLGVRGDACYSLQVPAWSPDDPGDAPTIEVILDIEH